MGIVGNVREAVGRRLTPVTVATRLDEMGNALRAEQDTNLMLMESMADLELSLEDRGWEKLVGRSKDEFTRDGLRRAADICRLMAVANPLIKRGVDTRIGYIFGTGVQVTARSRGDNGAQDINSVLTTFWNDPSNRKSFTGNQAQEEKERALETDGNVFLACFTTPRTGRVQIRSIPFDEVTNIITNPEDKNEPWFYRRQWTRTVLSPDGTTSERETQVTYYPDILFNPRQKPRTINGDPVNWNAPIYHVSVNKQDGWQFGVGDVYCAVPWARAYKEFLEDWATLVKSLSRFAWRIVAGNKSKAQRARTVLNRMTGVDGTGRGVPAGSAALSTPDLSMETIPKTGATIDSGSGRPLAAMVAAGLGIPVTALLADPGTTGARAVAETLTKPTQMPLEQRRSVWEEAYRTIVQYVIDQAALARLGGLRGASVYDPFTRSNTVILAGDTDRTIEIQWPDLSEESTKERVDSIVNAAGTNKIPPLVVARLLLQALDVDDVDTILDMLTDDEGNFVDPNPVMPVVQQVIDQTRPPEVPMAELEPAEQGADAA